MVTCDSCGREERTFPVTFPLNRENIWRGHLCEHDLTEIVASLGAALGSPEPKKAPKRKGRQTSASSAAETPRSPFVGTPDPTDTEKLGAPQKSPLADTEPETENKAEDSAKRRAEARKRVVERSVGAQKDAEVRSNKSNSEIDFAAVRAWAKSNNIPVSKRGRISADVIAQWQAASSARVA